jgi:LacI family transcriptional regulator
LVSYVINGGPRPVSAAARGRILDAITELDYRPDAVAQALRRASTQTIALLTPSPRNPFFAELAAAVEESVYRADHTLIIGITDDDPDRERHHLQSFTDRRVDGVILISSAPTRSLHHLGPAEIPVVVLDRTPGGGKYSSIHVDNILGARLATRHLHGHGHRVIGCVAGPEQLLVSTERVAGWRQEAAALGLDSSTWPVEFGDFDADGGLAAAERLLQAGPTPTAVFVASDIQALGVARTLRLNGLRVPGDVAMVSFDDTEFGGLVTPPLSSVTQPLAAMADAAVADLLKRIEDPAREVVHVQLAPELAIRESCGCAPSR